MSREHSNRILIGIVIAIILAFIGLAIFGENMKHVKFLGQFFMTTLRMIVVPLVLASVVAGVIRMGDVRKIGNIGIRTLGYYALTTALSVCLGIILVSIIKPGIGSGTEQAYLIEGIEAKKDLGWTDIILSFVHPNIFGALAEGAMLPIIVFSLVFGGIITTMGEAGKPLANLFESFNAAIMKLVNLIMWIAPIGIFGLVAARFAEANISAELARLGKYMGTVLLGLGIHGFIILPLICWILGRRNPLRHFLDMIPALLTAWSTASSAATLPLTMECVTDRANIRPRTAGFVLPLGATINMDGTALYEAVAAIFIAQAFGVELGFNSLVLIFVTATLVSIGAAAIPEAGLFMMVVVLSAVGLPLEGIGMIVVVDWLLDRFRTAVNVWGDSVGAAVIDRYVASEEDAGRLEAMPGAT
jgi:Na+/H+-dicarboxylate symporter